MQSWGRSGLPAVTAAPELVQTEAATVEWLAAASHLPLHRRGHVNSETALNAKTEKY